MNQKIILAILFAFTSSAVFVSEDELSIIASGGNTEKESYFVSTKNKLKSGKNNYILNGGAMYGESSDITDVSNWFAEFRYERKLSQNFDFFIADVIQADEFKGFWARSNYDLGFKYRIKQTKRFKTFLELGYRYTDINVVLQDDNESESKLRAFYESNYEFQKGNYMRFWLEYIPSIDSSNNYIVNMEPSVQFLVSNNFSMKTAFLWEYEDKPLPGIDQHDYQFRTSLVATF